MLNTRLIALLLMCVPAFGQFAVTSPAAASNQTGTFNFTVSSAPSGTAAVQYLLDDTRFTGPVLSAPWTYAYDVYHMATGPYTVSARAFDAAGNTLGTTATVSFTVTQPGRPGGSMVFSSPTPGATVSGAITLTALCTPASITDPPTGGPAEAIADWFYAVDGTVILQTANYAGPGPHTFTTTYDTTTLIDGTHEILTGCFHNEDAQSWIGRDRRLVTTNNGHIIAQVHASLGRVFLAPGTSKTLTATLFYADGSTAPAGFPAHSSSGFASSNTAVATVDYTGLVTAVAPGVADITITPLTTSRLAVTRIVVDAGAHVFPHFSKSGGAILNAYDPAKSFFMVAPYSIDSISLGQTNCGGASGTHCGTVFQASGVNTMTTGFYQNPTDVGNPPDYATWAASEDPTVAGLLANATTYGFSVIGTGDDIARLPAEMNNSLTGSYSSNSIAHAFTLMKNANAVLIEMVDEVEAVPYGSIPYYGSNPYQTSGAWLGLTPSIPNNAFSILMGKINAVSGRTPLSWPLSAKATGPAAGAWQGDPTMSDYASVYSAVQEKRAVNPWSPSLTQMRQDFDNSFEARVPYLQRNKPMIANIGITGGNYIKNGNPGTGDGGFNPGQDTFEGGENVPWNVAAQVMYWVSKGFAGIRPYGFDNAYWKIARNAGAPNGGAPQVGADPNQVGVSRWRAMSAAVTLVQSNITHFTQPIANSPDLGPDILTGARLGSVSRVLLASNLAQIPHTVAMDFSTFTYPGGMVSRTILNGETIHTDTISNGSSFTQNLLPGDNAVYIFTPPVGGGPTGGGVLITGLTRNSALLRPMGFSAASVQLEVVNWTNGRQIYTIASPAGTATATTVAPHFNKIKAGQYVYIRQCKDKNASCSGAISAYEGWHQVLTVPTTSSFTYAAPASATFSSTGDAMILLPVHDMDETLFANSQHLPAGFDVFQVGRNTTEEALDQKLYSRALQTDSEFLYWAHDAGSNSFTGTFRTPTIPLGDSYSMAPLATTSTHAFGHQAQPWVDPDDPEDSVVDADTGIRIARVTGPHLNQMYSEIPIGNRVFVIGGSWTSPQNAVTAGSYATTSAQNSALFIPFQNLGADITGAWDDQHTLWDIRFHARGTSTGPLTGCITVDSGISCATDAFDVNLGGTVSDVAFPSGAWPQSFRAWNPHVPLQRGNMANPTKQLYVKGHAVNWIGGNVYFPPIPVGTAVYVQGSGCSNTGPDICAAGAFGGDKQLNLYENLGELGGSTMTATATSGASTININSAVKLFPGSQIQIEPGTGNQETRNVAASYTLGSTTVPLTSAVGGTHAAGSVVFWAGLQDGCYGDSPNSPCPQAGVHVIAGSANAGATSVTLDNSPQGLYPGETVTFEILQTGYSETAVVASSYTIGSTTLPLTAPLAITHSVPGRGATSNQIEWGNSTKVQYYSAGLKVWLKNAGTTASVNFAMDEATSLQYWAAASDGKLDTCNSAPLNVTTDRAGHPWSEPKAGHLCNMGGSSVYLVIPSTLETRLVSTLSVSGLTSQAGISGNMTIDREPWLPGSATQFFAANGGRNGHVIQVQYTPQTGGVDDFSEYDPGLGSTPATDKLTYVDLTLSGTTPDQQVNALTGASASLFQTGLLGPFTYLGIFGGYSLFGASSSQDAPCLRAQTLGTTVVNVFDSFTTDPYRWGGCHVAPDGIGSLVRLTVNRNHKFSNTSPLGGPFQLDIKQIKKHGTWYSYSKTINSITCSGSVATITATDLGLDPTVGSATSPVFLSGGSGSWAAMNGTLKASHGGDNNTFTVPVNCTGFGGYPGGMTAGTTPPLLTGVVQSVVTGGAGETVVQPIDYNGNPLEHRITDGDPLYFTTTANTVFYAKATGYDAFHFGLFSNSALTTPATLSASGNPMYVYGDPCPSGLPARVTQQANGAQTGIFGDTGLATGLGRCTTFRLGGQPYSLYATTAEHTAYPCANDSGNMAKSCPQNLMVGDIISDLGNSEGDPFEEFVVAAITTNSSTDIEVTIGRRTGNLYGRDFYARNIQNGGRHWPGWVPIMTGTNQIAWFDAAHPYTTPLVMNPDFANCHGDTGHGFPAGKNTYVSNCYDDLVNLDPGVLLASYPVLTKQELIPNFAGSTASPFAAAPESYAEHRQTSVAAYDHNWKLDWWALNPLSGGNHSDAAGLWTNSITQVGTRPIYKLGLTAGAFTPAYDIKRQPLYVWSGYRLFPLKSGPGVLLADGDATTEAQCNVYVAGECVPGSAKGEVYIATNAVTYNSAQGGGYNTVPAATAMPMSFGRALQLRISPLNMDGTAERSLGTGLNAPGSHWSFQAINSGPEGTYAFFHGGYINGGRSDDYIMRLPSWPAKDRFNRTIFATLNVPVNTLTGHGTVATARARFGYHRFGPDASYYCSGDRQETCTTGTVTASTGDPYAFLSETATYTPCSAGCTLSIPTIPGMIVNYQVDYLDSGNSVLYSAPPLKGIAAP